MLSKKAKICPNFLYNFPWPFFELVDVNNTKYRFRRKVSKEQLFYKNLFYFGIAVDIYVINKMFSRCYQNGFLIKYIIEEAFNMVYIFFADFLNFFSWTSNLDFYKKFPQRDFNVDFKNYIFRRNHLQGFLQKIIFCREVINMNFPKSIFRVAFDL